MLCNGNSLVGLHHSSSVYGGNALASEIIDGVDLEAKLGDAQGAYNLNNGYSSPTGSAAGNAVTITPLLGYHGTFGGVDGDSKVR